MSDTLSVSNALSRSSLLEQIAHPTLVNPLAAQTSAATAAEQVWRVRQQQANQASGEAYQDAIDAQGNFDPAKYRQNLVAKGPGAALAAGAGVTSAQELQGQQIDQASKVRGQIASMLAPLADPNLTPEQRHAGMLNVANQALDAGMPRQQVLSTLLHVPNDPAGQLAAIEQIRRSLLPPSELQTVTHGQIGTEMGPGGMRVPTVLNRQTGAYTQAPGGVQTGLSPEAGSEISTITDANGNTITDTKAGHMKAGRVTPEGSLAPGFTQATASPGMVSALRGQEATPDGRTSVAGARGQMQVTPGFFKQYAQPGESFDSKRDVEEVAQRGIAVLEKKYPNDPARVAVAYFSGEGNVAPPGSPTPYKQDLKDANGTPTSAYVAGVIGRYKPDQTGGTGPKPGGTTGPAPGTVEAGRLTAEDSAKMGQDLVRRAEQVPNNRADYQNMLYDLKKLDTMGPGTERETIINAFLQKLTGYGITMSKDQVAGSESFNKIANLIASRQLASLGPTDSRQALAMGANPHLDLSKLGNERIIHMLQGNEDAVQAKASAWQNWLKTHGSGTYGQFSTEFNKHFDPRVFQSLYMEPQEIDDFRRSLKPDEATRFKEDYHYAQQQGWAR